MKKRFEDSIDLYTYTNDSEKAKQFEIRGSTTVFVNDEAVPLDVALSNEKMESYLKAFRLLFWVNFSLINYSLELETIVNAKKNNRL